MPHLIDSDIVIDYLGGDLATKRLVDRLVPGGIAVSMVTYMEVYQGLLRHPEPVRAQATLRPSWRALPSSRFRGGSPADAPNSAMR